MAGQNVAVVSNPGTLTGTRILGLWECARKHSIQPDDDNYLLVVSAKTWHALRVSEARRAWRELYRGLRMARKAGARVRLVLNDQEVG